MKPTPNLRTIPSILVKKSPRYTLFAAALAAGLSASCAFADFDPYHPPTDSPLDNSTALAAIEHALTVTLGHSTETIRIPVPVGFTTAIDNDFSAAVASVVQANETNTTPGMTPADIVAAASALRPTKTAKFMVNVTQVLIADGKTSLLGDTTTPGIVASAVIPSAKNAAAISAAVIGQLSLNASSTLHGQVDDVAASALTEFDDSTQIADIVGRQALAGKIVAAAIGATKKSTDPEQAAIAGASAKAALDNGGADQLEEITLQAVATTAGMKPDPTIVGNVVTSILAAVKAVDSSEATAAQVAAAAALGSNKVVLNFTNNYNAIKSAVDLNSAGYSAGALAAMDTALDAFKFILANYVKADVTSTGTAAQKYINGTSPATSAHPDHVEAVVAAAVELLPKSGADVITKVLASTHNSSTASDSDIITAGVRAYPSNAANVAKAIINGSTGVSTIESAIITGSTADLAGAIAAASVKALVDQTKYTQVASGATSAAKTIYPNALAQIALNVAKASSKQAGHAANTALAMIAVPGLTASQDAQILAGAVVADKKSAAAVGGTIDTVVAALPAGEPQRLAGLAGHTASNILNYVPAPHTLKDALFFYHYVTGTGGQTGTGLSGLAANDTAGAEAIFTGATQANPKAISALVAATLVYTGGADESSLVSLGTGANFKLGPNIQAAADAAVHVLGTTNDLFDYVRSANIQNSALGLDAATGAEIAAPGLSHIVGSAFGFSNPGAAAKIVPVLFSYSDIGHAKTGGGTADQVARAAALTAGVVDGVIAGEGGTGQTDPKIIAKTTSILKSTVSAAVKAALLLQGPSMEIATGDGQSATAISSSTPLPSKGAAGVITGYVSQAYNPALGDAKDVSAATIGAILTAAGKSAKAYVVDMAQAAADAAGTLYLQANPTVTSFNYGTDFSTIVTAFNGINTTLGTFAIQSAVNLGLQQALNNVAGAGAAGVVNYTLHPASGTAVTSIYEL